MTEEEWQQMVRLAEAHNGARRDSRQIMASAVIRHELDIETLKECLARVIVTLDKMVSETQTK